MPPHGAAGRFGGDGAGVGRGPPVSEGLSAPAGRLSPPRLSSWRTECSVAQIGAGRFRRRSYRRARGRGSTCPSSASRPSGRSGSTGRSRRCCCRRILLRMAGVAKHDFAGADAPVAIGAGEEDLGQHAKQIAGRACVLTCSTWSLGKTSIMRPMVCAALLVCSVPKDEGGRFRPEGDGMPMVS